MTAKALRKLARALPLAALLLVVMPASGAFAGRLLVTGHDADLHCTGQSGCHFVTVAVNYVRGGAPDPTKPVLILDHDESGSNSYQMAQALDQAFGENVVPRVVIDPRSPAFASARLSTDTYSAILVASDWTCGGCDLNANSTGDPEFTPDTDAIVARKADITAFFNEGGGLFAGAGADHGDGNPSNGKDNYYDFIPVPLGGLQVQAPFTLTPEGQALGFQDNPDAPGGSDINCCATHNSFQEPGLGSPLKVAERDSTLDPQTGAPVNAPETLFAEGTITGGHIDDPTPPPPPVRGESVNIAPVRGTVKVKLPPGTSGAKARSLGLRGAASGFVPLDGSVQVPVGSTLDTRRGVVKLTSARNTRGLTQKGQFTKGIFKTSQRKKNPLTTLTMMGGGLSACKTRVPNGGSAARRRSRRLFGNARGRFRTRGRHSSATVRGTKWSMTDTCRGTVTNVQRGSVLVRDFTLRKNRIVKAGHRYLAKAPKRRRKR